MGGRSGKGAAGGAAVQPSPLMCEALLFTTMCIVGLPVEVQVKDGSVYSGIFHTACVEKEYGIVLKKARKVVNGRCNANLGVGASVDTLVVLSGDLVQVIAKGVLLPAEGTVADVEGDSVEAVAGSVISPTCDAVLARRIDQDGENNSPYCSKAGHSHTNATGMPSGRTLPTKTLESICEVENGKENDICSEKWIAETSHVPVISVSEGQVGECKREGEAVPCSNVYVAPLEKVILPETCSSSPPTDVCPTHVNSIGDTHVAISTKTMPGERQCSTPVMMPVKVDTSDNEMAIYRGISSSNFHTSTHSTSTLQCKTSSYPSSSEMSTLSSSLANPASNTRTKEFKLNPGAKTFSPLFAIPRPAAPVVSTVANLGYIPNTYTMVPIATAQPALEMGPSSNCSSVPAKFVHHINVAAGNTGPVSQFSHPITGQVGTRIQPLRLSGQYNPVQSGAAYLLPNSQMVSVGRRGQVMYMHPVSQDAVQGIPTFTQVPPHALLAQYPANPPKLQGSPTPPLQLCVTQPIFPGGHQLPTLPSHVPFSNPLPSFQTIQVPGSSNFFTSKF